ncbi:hypothetical protein C7212DRAFT_316472 [Tuber magnatum]|uniref:Uncharacterized protein n=1 Tax=Tuber magnatum TaxID=42249 RepID=A0A317SXH2_9PEZI|nr:hypothetical protein C7212DRAFT_316472 [Tuber magnatum]
MDGRIPDVVGNWRVAKIEEKEDVPRDWWAVDTQIEIQFNESAMFSGHWKDPTHRCV